MPRLRSGHEFNAFPPLELISTGRSFALQIQEALRLEDEEVMSCPPSPALSGLSSLSSLSTHSTDLRGITPSPMGLTASSLGASLASPSVANSLARREGQGHPTDCSFAQGTSAAPDISPPPSPEGGTKRKRKRYASDKAAKKARRRDKRKRQQEELGPTAPRPPKHHEIPGFIQAGLAPVSHFPVNTTGYTTNRIGSIQPDAVWTFLKLRDISIEKVLAWDGVYVPLVHTPHPLLTRPCQTSHRYS